MSRKIFDGLGSVFGSRYDAKAVIESAMREMISDQPVLEFANSDGWRRIKAKYESIITGLEKQQLQLGRNVSNNADQIQKLSDFSAALALVLDITNQIVVAHTRANETIEKHKRGQTL